MTSPLRALHNLGQSVWFNDIRREYLEDGTMVKLIEENDTSGLTSNPAIFAYPAQIDLL